MTKKKAAPAAPESEKKRQLNLYVTQATVDLLQRIEVRDGTKLSAQVERAVRMWAASKGIKSHDLRHETDGAAGR